MSRSRAHQFDEGSSPSPVTGLADAIRGIEETRRRATAPVNVPELCAGLLAIVVEAMGAARGSLMVINPRTGRLRILAAFGLPQDIVGLDLQHQGRRISDWVRREGRALLLNGEVRDQRFDGSAPRDVESALCIPLTGRNGSIGVLNLARTSSSDPFGPPDLAIGEHLARALATTVEEATEREAAERCWRRFGSESTLPASIGPGLYQGRSYQLAFQHVPSFLWSGDVAERIAHPDGSQTLMIADVPGHGAEALEMGAMIRGLFLGLAQAHQSPADLTRLLGTGLHRRLEGRGFAALWMATLLPTGQLISCTAGYPPPFCVPTDGDEIKGLSTGGVLVGVAGDSKYHEQTLRLLPGDAIVAVSDGVLRARNATGQEFGQARVEELAVEHRRLPLDRMADAIVQGALEHGAGKVPVDDLTVLVLRYSRDG